MQVLIQSPGRDAAELELAVAQPVEQALQGLPDVRRVISTLQPGVVQVVVAFEPDADPFRSRLLVAEKLASVAGSFPEGTEAPLLTSAAGRLQEIQELVLEGPADRSHEAARHRGAGGGARGCSRCRASPASSCSAARSASVRSPSSPERMRLPRREPRAGARRAVEGSERDRGAGILEVRDKLAFVTYASLAATPEEARRLPVHTAHGLVALGDLAEIREAPGFRMGLARYQGFEVVSMRVVKQPGADTLERRARGAAVLPELQRALPAGMTLTLFYDQGELVAHALGGVGHALAIGGVFVALVLIVLLGNLRAAAIVLLLLPLAILGSALPLYALGEGLNAMTLGGLAIAVGLLVDAGVIMVENLAHRLARRVPRRRAGRHRRCRRRGGLADRHRGAGDPGGVHPAARDGRRRRPALRAARGGGGLGDGDLAGALVHPGAGARRALPAARHRARRAAAGGGAQARLPAAARLGAAPAPSCSGGAGTGGARHRARRRPRHRLPAGARRGRGAGADPAAFGHQPPAVDGANRQLEEALADLPGARPRTAAPAAASSPRIRCRTTSRTS